MDKRTVHRLEDYLNRRIGQRTVIGQGPPQGRRRVRRWIMRCDCGREEAVIVAAVVAKKALQCAGCVPVHTAGINSPGWKGSADIPHSFLNHYKHGALRRAIPFSISIDDVQVVWEAQGKVCAMTGCELVFRRGCRWGPSTASIDRLDSMLGYAPGNIQIVHKDVNMAKQLMSNDELVAFCRRVIAWAERS